jgi:hypothetical protein
VKVAAAGGLGR